MEDEKRENFEENFSNKPQESNDEKPQIQLDEKKPSKPSILNNIPKHNWAITTYIFGILTVFLLVSSFTGGITGNAINENVAGEKLVGYFNNVTGGGVELVEVTDIGNLYEVTVSYEEQDIPVYITKDGDYLVSGAVLLSELEGESQVESEPVSTDVPKSDKPLVELFIMTHCPYGTQAEKGMIPVLELLEKNIEGDIKFVHYFMHAPEEDETPRQICIREEQSEKYIPYLRCFLEGDGNADATGYIANGNDPATCIARVNIDQSKLNDCIANRAEDYYAEDSALSEGYGVGGSPTLVVNGVIVSSARSSSAYLETICSAFNNAPSECDEILDSSSPSPGFGWEIPDTNAATGAQC